MRTPKGSSFHVVASFIFLLLLFSLTGCESKYSDLDLSMYHYRDTTALVKFVYDASLMLRQENGLDYIRKNPDQFKTPDYYLYIYNMEGINLYHAGMPQLEGKSLRDATDKNGKKMIGLVLDALKNPNNPHAWVHYSWWKPDKFYPVPKSSCHFKVKTAEGNVLFVGAGIDYPHEEQEFIRIIVDDATQLIKEKGAAAIAEISDPVSKYNYRDVHVFVFRSDGGILISPAINCDFPQTHLKECIDEVGHRPFAKALEELESKDGAWGVFMSKNRYQRKLIKKCLYVRKTIMDKETIYVAAITDLPEPPY